MCYIFYIVDYGLIQKLTNNNRRHNVFDILQSWFWVQSVIENLKKQTLSVSYITAFILGTFGNLPVIKSDTLC